MAEEMERVPLPRRLPRAPGLRVLPFPEMAESREKERRGGKSKVTLWTGHICDDRGNSKGRCRVGTVSQGPGRKPGEGERELNQKTLYKGVGGV